MNEIEQEIATVTGASGVSRDAVLQELWSGYGEIVRYSLSGCALPSVVVKQIKLPAEVAHPRGWGSDRGHARKLRSYEVETAWYSHFAADCGDEARVARCYGVIGEGVDVALILEDLDAAGYDRRVQDADELALQAALGWLAAFHARWQGASTDRLWPRGSYWHLATRPDEWAAMPEGPLKQHATALDQALENARFKTLIHGDAKIANFCFDSSGQRLAAVDFQYVGLGVGVCDLAYFLGSCLDGQALEERGAQCCDFYFACLEGQLLARDDMAAAEIKALIHEWRTLYPVAWADFERFLAGWSPGHPKLNSYSARMTRQALSRLV